ncbi:MAG: hypothetical protein AAF721_19385 [Myxococcota bacterium]
MTSPPNFAASLIDAPQRYPRLFDHMARAGWTANRRVDWCGDPEDPSLSIHLAGFDINDYADALLDNMQGLVVGRDAYPRRNQFEVATGPRWLGGYDASDSIYVKELAGVAELTPVLVCEETIIWVRPNGTAFSPGPMFQLALEAETVFLAMDWLLYREPLPGFDLQPIPAELRPPGYRE